MGMRALGIMVVVLAGCGSKASGPSKAECAGYVDHASRLEQAGSDDYMPMFKYSGSERDVFLARCPKALTKKMIDCAIAAKTLPQLDACQPRRSVDDAIEGDDKDDDQRGPVVEEQVAAAPGEAARIAEQRAAEERMMREARGLPPEEAPPPRPEEIKAPEPAAGSTTSFDTTSQDDPPPEEEELRITSVSPDTGVHTGGTVVEIEGDFTTDDAGSAKVYFGKRVARIVRYDRGKLIVEAPPGELAETVDVLLVIEPSKGSPFELKLARAFTYADTEGMVLDEIDDE